MASINPTDEAAERIRRSLRNIGLGLLVVGAFAESVEGIVRDVRMRVAAWEREGLSRVDSRSSQVVALAVAVLESASNGAKGPRR